jgi:hypothetical protein
MDQEPSPQADEQGERDRVARELAEARFALPGTVATRYMRCGKATCRCKADPPQLHGPYYQWTRKIDGKTVARWLTEEQLARYQPWFANAQRLRQLFTELEALSLRIAERAEGWEPQPSPTGRQPRRTS